MNFEIVSLFYDYSEEQVLFHPLQKQQLHWDLPSSFFLTTEPLALSLVRLDITVDDVKVFSLLPFEKLSIEGGTVIRERER